MAVKSTLYQDDPNIVDYTPVSATTAGAIVESSGKAGQVTSDLAAGEKGAIRIKGIIKVNKTHPAIADGVNIYWDNDGTDVGVITGGAATATSTSGDFLLGRSLAAAGTNVTQVIVALNESVPVSIVDLNEGTYSGTMPAACTAGTYDETIAENAIETTLEVLRKAGVIAI